MEFDAQLPTWQKLSSKLVGALLAVLFLALLVISATLLLSWQLEGSSAAINETGSLRMHGYRAHFLATEIKQTKGNSDAARQNLQQEIAEIDSVYALLKQGDPQRPLYLPDRAHLHQKFTESYLRWQTNIRPALLSLTRPEKSDLWTSLNAQVPLFVSEIDDLVKLIEKDSEQRASLLRTSQMGLLALALLGTVVLIYVMFVFVIHPVNRLQEGMQRMSEHDFDVRLAVESSDEFGQLANGFNQMVGKLDNLYGNLETLVARKTSELENQNRELALLYDCAAFLQQPQIIDSLCEGFLQRISSYFKAEGGSVRVLDPQRGNLHLVVHQGLSQEIADNEHCMKVGDCLCGEAVEKKITVIHDLRTIDKKQELLCHKAGFESVSVFQIYAKKQHLGFFNLHFNQAHEFRENEVVLLDTLGQLLGVALENIRLATRERAMAVSEERNLVAQGLHDSIAQGLTFMNIQVQMLEESLAAGKLEDAAEIAPALRAGVQESYEDVRELLHNFRTKLAEGNLVHSLETTIEKFRRQTAIAVELDADSDGAPLPREHQLQILFIVQEALSNIRKHALASRVNIRLKDQQDIELTIQDNGVGFDATTLREKGESHVGLKIMSERAQRMHAQFNVVSEPGSGTTVSMVLARDQRQAA